MYKQDLSTCSWNYVFSVNESLNVRCFYDEWCLMCTLIIFSCPGCKVASQSFCHSNVSIFWIQSAFIKWHGRSCTNSARSLLAGTFHRFLWKILIHWTTCAIASLTSCTLSAFPSGHMTIKTTMSHLTNAYLCHTENRFFVLKITNKFTVSVWAYYYVPPLWVRRHFLVLFVCLHV